MKKILLLVFIVGSSILSNAQSFEGKLEYMKTQQPAAVIELPYAEDVVEGGIKNYFTKQGAKSSSTKGLLVFKNVTVEGSTEKPLLDLYFKTERKSRKEKDVTVVYLTAGHPGENIAVRLPGDKYGLPETQAFLNVFTPHLEDYSVGLQITEQENVIKKADKKYAGLISDSTDFQKRKIALEERIIENGADLKNQRNDQERQRQILEALRARKK